jgi:predicted nucleic acid-binding protein
VPDLFALDTSVYIRALRDASALAELKRFRKRTGLRLVIAGVVAMELGAGAVSDQHEAAVSDLLEPYAARGLVIPVSYASCTQAGRVLAALARQERIDLARAPRSLTNDVLIAASCREAGVVLVTDNSRDFTAIQRHLRGFRFVPPWPLPGRPR